MGVSFRLRSVECSNHLGRSRGQSVHPFEWLVSRASSIHAPIQFQGGQSSVSDAIKNGSKALREVMRAWRVTTPEELSGWLRSRGFPATRPGQHLSARAQEFIFHEGGVLDARVALLETAFVLITLEPGRASGIPRVSDASRIAPRRTATGSIPPVVPSESWEQLDEVDLYERFLGRVSMLKSCPYFFWGRLHQCWTVALHERQRARQAHDTVGEERAWKLFALIPLMLLHRPRGSGSLGRDELAKRADDFARGHWIALLRDSSRIESSATRAGIEGPARIDGSSVGPEDLGHVGGIAREAASSQRHGHSPECHGVCP